jgi:hypothetical protein
VNAGFGQVSRRLFLAIGVWLAAACNAAPRESLDACYVRTEAFAPAVAASGALEAAQSFVGVRRKTDKLFDLDIAVSGPPDASCLLTGVARLRGEPGHEALAMVIRPDPTRKSGRTGTLCQVFVQLTPDALELSTTPSSCQAQALCEGKVELDGQRFDHATKLPAGAKGPCFARRAPASQ